MLKPRRAIADSLRGPDITPVDPSAERPVVSVMIPVYARADFLETALRGVLSNDLGSRQMHIEVVDDASPGADIRSIVERIGKGRIDYFRNDEHLGMVATLNLCVRRSRGQMVHLLPDDDNTLPGFYEILSRALAKSPEAAMAFSRFATTDEQDRVGTMSPEEAAASGILENFSERLATLPRFPLAAALVRREAFESLGGFRTELGLAADWEFFQRLLAFYPIYHEIGVLACHRHHAGSATRRSLTNGSLILDAQSAIAAARPMLPPDKADALVEQALAEQTQRAVQGITESFTLNNLAGAIAQTMALVRVSRDPRLKAALTSNWVREYQRQAQALAERADGDAAEAARNALADAWRAVPPEMVEPLWQGGWGFVQQAMRVCRGVLSPRPVAKPGVLLADMLDAPADELPDNFELEKIPAWLLDEYLAYLHENPPVPALAGELQRRVAFLERWVECLDQKRLKQPPSPIWQQAATMFTQKANFIFACSAPCDLKNLYQGRARIIEWTLAQFRHPLDWTIPPRPLGRKLRLGVLSQNFGGHGDLFTTLPAFAYLDRDLFDVVLLALQATGQRMERLCSGHADNLITLSGDLPRMVQSIRQLELDVLLIGDRLTSLPVLSLPLAAHRLARLQVVCGGACVTTGLRNVDAFLTGALTERADDAEDFTEKLLVIDGPSPGIDFGTEENLRPQQAHTRGQFEMTDDQVLFASAVNFYKLTPEIEDAWARILKAVEGSRLLLNCFGPHWAVSYQLKGLMDRLSAAMERHGLTMQRLIVLPPCQSRADVAARIGVADVYLDGFPFTGSKSLFDALVGSVPPVVIEGPQHRSRLASGYLRELELPELITADVEAYVNLAIGLARDPARRAALKERIARGMKSNPRFRDSRWFSSQVQKVLLAELGV